MCLPNALGRRFPQVTEHITSDILSLGIDDPFGGMSVASFVIDVQETIPLKFFYKKTQTNTLLLILLGG